MHKNKTVNLFVMAGQSNMQGCMGDAEGYPPDIDNIDNEIPFYWEAPTEDCNSNREWLSLQPQPERFPKGYFGPEITFARNLYKAGYTPAIFKYSLGSTTLENHWKRVGGNGLYDSMLEELGYALSMLKKDGFDFVFGGFVWIQGESEPTMGCVEKYAENLTALIEHFRGHVADNESLPVILGVDEQHSEMREEPRVVEYQQEFAGKDHYTEFTSMYGLEKADATHLKPEGVSKHGEILFDAFEKINNNRKGDYYDKA